MNSDKKILRVFPRRTKATPMDAMVRVDCGPDWFDEADEVHISVTFTWDLARAEDLARAWKHVAPVKIGGPALGIPAGAFTPGQYLASGYVITSRGCPNSCPHCLVPRRQGLLQELPITPGWIVQDDNFLACSEDHIRRVFAMLGKFKSDAELRGMEARRLKPWHCELIGKLHPSQVFFACDREDDLDPLRAAMATMKAVEKDTGLHVAEQWRNRCYVLIGFENETISQAEARLLKVYRAGFLPFAMLYHDQDGKVREDLKPLLEFWSRPGNLKRYIKTKQGKESKHEV